MTIQTAVENLYSTGNHTKTLPVDSIISIVQQFLAWGAIPKEAANSLIKELKDFAKPIAIESVKALLATYLGGPSSRAGERPGPEGGFGYGSSTLVCNSFNTAPPRTIVAPAPKKPKPNKPKAAPETSCSPPPASQPPK